MSEKSWHIILQLLSVFASVWYYTPFCLHTEQMKRKRGLPLRWDTRRCGDGQIQSTCTVGEKIFSCAISITPWELIRAVLRVMSQRTKCCSSFNQNNAVFVCFCTTPWMHFFWIGCTVIEQITYIISVKAAQGKEDLLLPLWMYYFPITEDPDVLLNSTICHKESFI